MILRSIFLFMLFAFSLCACQNKDKTVTAEKISNSTNKVLLSSEINWEQLNPARGDQSPQAGTIWGNRNGTEATGFLAKFADGFSSPPHIHNVSYRAVVIKGLVHNADAAAPNMWMPVASFWTQPAGQAHITSAKGLENIALVEIDHGPYLVKPIADTFDNGERPINVDASNIVWLSHEKTTWIAQKCAAEISFLWEHKNDTKMQGVFIKLPIGFKGQIESNGSVFHAVVVEGLLAYQLPQNQEIKSLDAASYFGSSENAVHSIVNTSKNDVIIYCKTNGTLKISEA